MHRPQEFIPASESSTAGKDSYQTHEQDIYSLPESEYGGSEPLSDEDIESNCPRVQSHPSPPLRHPTMTGTTIAIELEIVAKKKKTR
jgi:hypothetical protein